MSEPVVLTDDMILRAVQDKLLVQRITSLRQFSPEGQAEAARALKTCGPCGRKQLRRQATTVDLRKARTLIANLGPQQQKALKSFFNAPRLQIDYKAPNRATARRVIY